MRYYGFGNYYLSSLQQGLQAHHVCVEMFNDFNDEGRPFEDQSEQWRYLNDWARDHKTIVLLNGGNSKDLKELYEFFVAGSRQDQNAFPFADFSEDEQSLCGALTSVGIVLSPRIYDTAAEDRQNGGKYEYRNSSVVRHGRPLLNDWEEELIVRLNRYGLAK